MPIYEFICKNCKEEFELLVYSKEEEVCPKCGSKNLTKKISKVIFKSAKESGGSSSSSCSSCSSGNCSTCK